MKKVLETLLMSLIMTSSILAQDCYFNPQDDPSATVNGYIISGNFSQESSKDKIINDVVMLKQLPLQEGFLLNTFSSDLNGNKVLKNGTTIINYNLENVKRRMVKGDFDNDGHIDDFILIYKTGIASMRFDLFKSNGASQPSFTKSTVYELNGYDPDKITGRIVSGDFDNDGNWDDIAAFYDYGNGETRIHTFRSTGNTFVYSSSVGWWNSTGYTATRVTDRVVSGDFDHDGHVDDVAAFYDYGNGETRIHVWLSTGSNFWYQSSVGWWKFKNFEASKISRRVISLNVDRDGNNYDDIAVFYATDNNVPKMHTFESNGSSFQWNPYKWGGSTISLTTVPGSSIDNANNFSGKIVEYDSRTSRVFQGKPSDIVAFHKHVTPRYRFWKVKKNITGQDYYDYSEPYYCGSKKLIKEDEVKTINAFPNPTKSITTIEIPESLIDGTSRIEIHDLFGRLVFSDEIISSTIKIDLSNENKGIYLVKVIGKLNNHILKIVKE